jgi:adenine-specific DNA-methyltransferase
VLPELEASESTERSLGTSSHRSLGAYYTPPSAAIAMAEWALADGARDVLEPSMGDGSFLSAVRTAARSHEIPVALWGAELAADTYREVVSAGLIEPSRAFKTDFLGIDPFPVDAVIGNPPYVRLRHLPNVEAKRALDASERILGSRMEPGGSVWMPFVLHASQFLRPGGRIAFVLPYDITYVRYARPLWRYLAASYASLRVVRIHERVFPDIMQDVILFFADGYGKTTSSVRFEAYERLRDFTGRAASAATDIAIERITSGGRPFVESLLPAELRTLLDVTLSEKLVPARSLVQFNIGYVTGDKTFFHPTDDVSERYRLPSEHLRPALTSSRQLRKAGVRTSGLPEKAKAHLFLPTVRPISGSEHDYIQSGVDAGVSERFKCKIRKPWYVTPGVKVPDVILPVFADTPLMLLNDAQFVASNSLLCGYLREEQSGEAMLARWYTSLTLLQVEIEVHSLGGGVRVFVPNEAGAVRLPEHVVSSPDAIRRLHDAVRRGEHSRAYAEGDTAVLIGQVGLTASNVSLIREGVTILAHWRNSVRTSRLSAE